MHPFLDRTVAFLEVAADKRDAFGVVDGAVHDVVLERAAVFRDDDLRMPVALVDPVEELAATPGHDVPVHQGLLPGGIAGQEDVLIFADAAVAIGIGLDLRSGPHGGGVVRGVMVEPEEVGGVLEEGAVLFGELGEAVGHPLSHARRIVALVDRVGEPTEVELEGTLRRLAVGRRFGSGFAPVGVVRDADAPALTAAKVLIVDADGAGVAAEQLVGDRIGLAAGFPSRRHHSVVVSKNRDDPRLVERDPVLYAIAEVLEADSGVGGIHVGKVGTAPAIHLELQGQGKIPVVERDPGGDAVFEKGIDEFVVETDALRIHRAATLRKNARPRERQAIGPQSKVRHQSHVLAEAVVVIAGDIAGVAAENFTRGVGEGIPDGEALAAFQPGPLDLVAGGGGAEGKGVGKSQHTRRELGSRPMANKAGAGLR